MDIKEKEHLEKIAEARLQWDDYPSAIEIYEKLSEDGDWFGSHMLGVIYEWKGKEGSNNLSTAMKWYRKALSQDDNPKTHFMIARHYYYGLNCKEDYTLAYDHLLKSRSDEEPIADVMIAELLYHGYGVEKDVKKAKALFKSVAKRGYLAGDLGIARILYKEKNYIRSFFIFLVLSINVFKLIFSDTNHPKLEGLGGKRGQPWLPIKWKE